MSRLSRLIRKFHRPRPPQRLSPEAEALFDDIMSPVPRGGVFIDLGANVGNVAKKALEYCPKVYAFEPDPTALAVLRSRLGSEPRVEIISKAAGATARTAKFFRRRDQNTEYSSLLRHEVHDGKELDVEVVDLVRFVRELAQPVAAIKMDIEGAEAECLEAILDSGIHRSIGVILVETHDRFSAEIAERLDRIRARIAKEQIKNINLEWL